MGAGFEVRNSSSSAASELPEATFTIQALAWQPSWADVNLDAARTALAAAYASAFDELTKRVEAARNAR